MQRGEAFADCAERNFQGGELGAESLLFDLQRLEFAALLRGFCLQEIELRLAHAGAFLEGVDGGREQLALARRLGYEEYPRQTFLEEYRRITRRARRAMERVVGSQQRFSGKYNIGLYEAIQISERNDERAFLSVYLSGPDARTSLDHRFRLIRALGFPALSRLRGLHLRLGRDWVACVDPDPGTTVSLLELIKRLEELLERRVELTFDAWRVGDQRYYVSDTSKFGAATGWRARTDVEQGLLALCDWFRSEERSARPALAPVAAAALPVGARG